MDKRKQGFLLLSYLSISMHRDILWFPNFQHVNSLPRCIRKRRDLVGAFLNFFEMGKI